MIKDIKTEEDIQIMVDTFYDKALKSKLIGHFFNEVVRLKLKEHMPIMYAFWSDILLGTSTYKGNPMVKHLALNSKVKLEAKHFEEWLKLWNKNIDLHFIGAKADEAKTRAKSIAGVMQYKLSLQ